MTVYGVVVDLSKPIPEIYGGTIIGTSQPNIESMTVTPCPTVSVAIPEVGSVIFISTPPGAEIFLAMTGQTLVDQNTVTSIIGNNITDLGPGSYDYKLTLPGYLDKTGTFIITAGSTTTVDVSLEHAPAEMGGNIILMAGLAIGFIYAAIRKKKKEHQ